MKEPILVIMAAGMGSRYGGLKQMDKIGSGGELIIDFSLFDAMSAGFEKVIFIIKEEMENDFRELIDKRSGRFLKVEYAFQKLSDLPKGFKVPEGREKPWGTCHAVMSAGHLLDGPFAVINADDFYGAGAFLSMYDFLASTKEKDLGKYAMIGYELENTLTKNGYVARGICQTDQDGYLIDIVERTKISWHDGNITYKDEGENLMLVPEGTPVSMNFWGFTADFLDEMISMFPAFLEDAQKNNPLKGEFFLPMAVDKLLKAGKATVKVIPSKDRWHGVTYKEDRQDVVSAMQALKDKGLYPDVLWK